MSVRPHGITRLPLDRLSWDLVFGVIFRKSVQKIQVSLKSDKNNRYFIWNQYIYFWSYLTALLIEWEIFQLKIVQKIRTQILYSIYIFFFRKSCRLWDNVGKYCRVGQATDDNIAHAHCILDTQGSKHTRRICNIYCFSTATMVALTRLNVTLYVYCLYCFKFRSAL
jgi:hypothetical protein